MLPTGLSLLWEAGDPREVLRARFGFADAAATSAWVSVIMADHWDVVVLDCPRIVLSSDHAIVWVSTAGGPLVIKWSRARHRFSSLEQAARLIGRLDRSGIPVAAPVITSDGQVRKVVDGPLGPLSVAVVPEITGDWLDVDDERAVYAAGVCLARLHTALQDDPLEFERPSSAVPPLASVIERWLDDHDHGWSPAASARLRAMLPGLPTLEGEAHLVHNDFRAANLLTRDSEIVAVLDFDEVTRIHPLSDLARASVYLGTRFTDWRPTSVAVRDRFRAGYVSRRPLTTADDHWLAVLIRWHALMAVQTEGDPAGWADA